MRIAHLSDIHLDTTPLRAWHLLGKRFTGIVWAKVGGRKSRHQSAVVEQAFEVVRSLDCDQIVVTGDLTNLATVGEFENAKRFLEKHTDPRCPLSVIPGNHDRYTVDSAVRKLFERYFSPLIQSDLPELSNGTWPYVKLFDGLAIIGLDSAIPLPPFMAGGRIGAKQRQRLSNILAHPDVEQRFSVVLIHHHLYKPENKRTEFPRHLFDKHAVRDVLVQGGANLVLHGHNHWYGFRQVEDTLICEAGSTSIARYSDPRHGGKFNIYHIEEGALRSFDTYLYRENQGFELWKSWQIGRFGPVRSEDDAKL